MLMLDLAEQQHSFALRGIEQALKQHQQLTGLHLPC
jgi:hypothetical protein